MVLRQTLVDQIKGDALDRFDVLTEMGFSSSTSPDNASSDTLSGEFFRKVFSSTTKDSVGFTNLFESVLGLTEGNGNTFNKLGLFTDHAGNTLKLNQVLETGIAKTADREINCAFELSIEFIDST